MPEKFFDCEAELDNIVDAIEEGNCIVVIGPELCLMQKGVPDGEGSIQDHISKTIVKEIPYLREEGFFYCTNDGQNEEIIKLIRKFYRDLQPNEMYPQLASIPFRLYISLSPDTILEQQFQSSHLLHQFDYHFPESGSRNIEKENKILPPSFSLPLIYNLLGSHSDKDSIVFTYEALFTYLTTIFTENASRGYISECLKQSSIILFLGFRFEKWYLKLLFFLMKKKWIMDNDRYKKIGKKAILFSQSVPSDNILDFYKSEFSFSFCPLDQFKFIDDLYRKCEGKQMLRGQKKTAARIKEEIAQYIVKRKTEEAIKLLPAVSNQDNQAEVDAIIGECNSNNEEFLDKRITSDQYEVTKSKLNQRLKNLLASIN